MYLPRSPSGNDNGGIDSGVDTVNNDRTQYTVKGIQKQTVDSMRHAARKEGMKIGSWVSVRLREAAERSLNGENVDDLDLHKLQKSIEDIKMIMEANQTLVGELMNEIADLSRFQRAMMTVLIEKNSSS